MKTPRYYLCRTIKYLDGTLKKNNSVNENSIDLLLESFALELNKRWKIDDSLKELLKNFDDFVKGDLEYKGKKQDKEKDNFYIS